MPRNRPKLTMQKPERHHWHCPVAIIVNPGHISYSAAVYPCRLQAGKCRNARHFLALEIKPNLRILTAKLISHCQTKFTYPKFDTKSLQSLQSDPSCFHTLILFLKSSRLFKFFEAKSLKDLDQICYYLQNFLENQCS